MYASRLSDGGNSGQSLSGWSMCMSMVCGQVLPGAVAVQHNTVQLRENLAENVSKGGEEGGAGGAGGGHNEAAVQQK